MDRAKEMAEENIQYGNFYDAIQTKSTRGSYVCDFERFMNFLVEKKFLSNNEDFTKLAAFDAGKCTDLMKIYIKNMKKRNLKPLSVNAYIAPVFLFFDMNRIGLFKKEINKVRDKNDIKSSGHTPVTDEELQDMITVSSHPKDIALVLFLASVGMRPGGINDPVLCMKHLEYMVDPNNSTNTKYCYSVKVYDDSRQHYWSFLTPEATKALDRYFTWRKNFKHEKFTENSPIFANISKTDGMGNMDKSSLYRILNKIYTKSQLKRKKIGNNYDKAITYMYRIRFNTILKLNNNVNSNIAEKLMAHKKGLDGSYLQPTREECYTEFVKAIPELTVDPSERQKVELEKKQDKINELEVKEDKINELESMVIQMRDKQSAEPSLEIRNEIIKILREKRIL